MPPNCVRDPTQDCIGYAEAQILRHQLEELSRKQAEYQDRNSQDHKEFYNRLEFGEKAQAVTQQQLAQILTDTTEIKADVKEQSKALTTAIEGQKASLSNAIEKQNEKIEQQNRAITEMQMEPAQKWKKLTWEVVKILLFLGAGAVLTLAGLGAFAP